MNSPKHEGLLDPVVSDYEVKMSTPDKTIQFATRRGHRLVYGAFPEGDGTYVIAWKDVDKDDHFTHWDFDYDKWNTINTFVSLQGAMSAIRRRIKRF